MEHEQDILVLRSKPDISVPTGSYIHHECCTRVWEHDWWLKEVATLSGQFYSSSTHMTRYCRRQWIWQHVPRPISIPLKTRPCLCQRRSRHSTPHHPKCHLDNLLVHLSLHSCESQWSFLNGNWLVNHVSVTLFIFYKTKWRKLWCIAVLHHLPSNLFGLQFSLQCSIGFLSLPSCIQSIELLRGYLVQGPKAVWVFRGLSGFPLCLEGKNLPLH